MNIPITRSTGMAVIIMTPLRRYHPEIYSASSLVAGRGWSDHRRLGLPFFENQAVEKDYNPLNQVPLTVATSKECRWDFYPKRYRYPANIQTNNQAGYAQALQLLGGPDLTTTPLWWNAK